MWEDADVLLLQVDFDELAESLVQLERRCKASWDSLKVITKHEYKSVLKSKLTDFLKESTQKIIILKVVHRRVLNRSVTTPLELVWAMQGSKVPGSLSHSHCLILTGMKEGACGC